MSAVDIVEPWERMTRGQPPRVRRFRSTGKIAMAVDYLGTRGRWRACVLRTDGEWRWRMTGFPSAHEAMAAADRHLRIDPEFRHLVPAEDADRLLALAESLP